MTDLRRLARLYLRFLGLRLQTYAEYRGDAVLLAGSAVLADGLGLVFLWVVFEQIPTIAGWSRAEVLLMYGLVVCSGGVTQLCFDGFWTMGSAVHEGRFDVFLTRPLPPLFSVVTYWMSPEGIGAVVLGTVICGVALADIHPHVTLLGVAIAGVLVASGVALRVGVTLIVNTIGFWTNGPLASSAYLVSEPFYELASYPLQVYGRLLGTALSTAVPVAFVGVMPATFIARGVHANAWTLAGPAVAAAVWCLGLLLFRRGLRSYDSTGGFHGR